MRLEYLLALIVSLAILLAAIIVYFSNKEQKKQTRELVDKTREDWAGCLAAVEKLNEKEANALKYALSCKDDLIAEKDARIQQLEEEIALKDFIMSCARVDGTLDEEKLKSGLGKMQKLDITCEATR